MRFLGLVFVCSVFCISSYSSDHIDGPVTTANRVADLTDLFAFPSTTPGHAGYVTLILDMYPIVSVKGHFSEKVNYDIVLRRATIKGKGTSTAISTNPQDQVKISCSFLTAAPVTADHKVNCVANVAGQTKPTLMASSKFEAIHNEIQPGEDFQVYAGMTQDPFFFDGVFAVLASKEINLPVFLQLHQNTMAGTNCLTVVIEAELARLFPTNTPSLIGISAQSMATDGAPGPNATYHRIDRIGRPEITNVTMVAHTKSDKIKVRQYGNKNLHKDLVEIDTAADDAEMRDKYNQDDIFSPYGGQDQYLQRISRNILIYDLVDKKADWQDQDRQALAKVLMNDFLLLDVSKDCSQNSYLEIEKSTLHGKPYQTCGGRKLTDDVMDTIFTLYEGGYNGKHVSDGVSKPTGTLSSTFPYLGPADKSFQARAKDWLVKNLFKIKDPADQQVQPQ